MNRKGLMVSLFLLAHAALIHAATVTLKDGSTIRGTVVGATARELQVNTPDGILNISSDRIERVDYSESATPPAPPVTADAPYSSNRYRPDIREHEFGNSMFSIGLGFAAPTSEIDLTPSGEGKSDNGDTGVLLSSQYLYGVNSKVGLGFDVEYFNRSDASSQSLLEFANSDVSGSSLLLLGIVKYSFVDHGSVRPYILGGLGANRTSTRVESTPFGGLAWNDGSDSGDTRALYDDSSWGLATTARLGMDFMLSDPGVFTLELGWTGIRNPDIEPTPFGKFLELNDIDGKLDTITVAARWGWRF